MNRKEEVTCISEAQEQLSLLASYQKSKQRATDTSVASLKKLGKETLEAKYETTYSSHVYENPDEIKSREAAIDEKWVELDNLAEAKKAVLDEDLAREKEKERLRLMFAGQAVEFIRWTGDQAENTANTQFGFTLEEVEAYKTKLDADHDALRKEAEAKKTEYESTFTAMTEMGVRLFSFIYIYTSSYFLFIFSFS